MFNLKCYHHHRHCRRHPLHPILFLQSNFAFPDLNLSLPFPAYECFAQNTLNPQGPFKKANMMIISQFHTRQLQSILTELHIFVSWFAVCFGFRWEHLPSLNWARLCRAALCDPRRAIGGMAGKAATEQFLGKIVWNNWVGGIGRCRMGQKIWEYIKTLNHQN